MPSRPCNPLFRVLGTVVLAAFPALAGAQAAGPATLADAPEMQQRIRDERQRGNAEEAWNLEQDLLRIAVRNPSDVRTARIFRDVGDHRIDTLLRYDAGEYPPEIALGCYYVGRGQFPEIAQRGSQSLSAGPGRDAGSETCATGSRRTARRALAEEALVFYVESARIFVDSENVDRNELSEIFAKLLETGYLASNYSIGRSSLQSLLARQESNAEPALARARTIAYMGDWDMLFAEYFGTKYIDSATLAYERALALLAEEDAAEADFDSIFSPQTPVLLPAFAANRLMSPQTAGSTGHVDVAFEIRDNGRSARVTALDSSANASRAVTRDVVNMIRQGRFRPIAENGRLLESAPVTVRYYIND